MKYLSIAMLPFLLLFGSCRHTEGVKPATTVPLVPTIPQATIADTIAGPHLWHGTYSFDHAVTNISSTAMTIVKLNDSTLSISGDPCPSLTLNLTLPYRTTDSVKGVAIFGYYPPVLYYYYNVDSINLKIFGSGVHSDYLDIWTP